MNKKLFNWQDIRSENVKDNLKRQRKLIFFKKTITFSVKKGSNN